MSEGRGISIWMIELGMPRCKRALLLPFILLKGIKLRLNHGLSHFQRWINSTKGSHFLGGIVKVLLNYPLDEANFYCFFPTGYWRTIAIAFGVVSGTVDQKTPEWVQVSQRISLIDRLSIFKRFECTTLISKKFAVWLLSSNSWPAGLSSYGKAVSA